MKTPSLVLCAILALFAAACRKAERTPPASRLSEAVRGLKASPKCGAIIPLEWAPSWPVPADGPGEFKVFFYPMTMSPPAPPALFEPAGEALFRAASGEALKCRRYDRPVRGVEGPRWPAAVAPLTMEQFDAKRARLLAATEKAGALYSSKKPLSSGQAASVRTYKALFDAFAEPALRSHYEALNPAFWKWVKDSAG